MEEIQRKLNEAAMEGNTMSLLRLLEEDALVIDRCAAGCLAQTPLHIAAMLGHLEFTIALLNRKRGLAKELDFRRWSPLYLASANGHLEVVKTLLLVNPDMCFVQDRDGWSPLHVAVINGRFEVLKELVRAKPAAVWVQGERGQTILHLCVEYSRFDALKFLMETIIDHEFLNLKDNDGFTVLHLAVAEREAEITNLLITKTTVEVNARSANSFTALDIVLAQGRRSAKDAEIQDLLREAGAVSVQDILSSAQESEVIRPRDPSLIPFKTPQSRSKHLRKHHERKNDITWLEKKQNALMVVACLIATMAFQAGINPPGGTWQASGQDPVSGRSYEAGASIVADMNPRAYTSFVAYNTTSFLASLIVILILISGIPLRRRVPIVILMIVMWIAVTTMAFTYLVSLYCLSRREGRVSRMDHLIPLTFFVLIGLLVAAHCLRFRFKMVKFARRLMGKDPPPNSVVPTQEDC